MFWRDLTDFFVYVELKPKFSRKRHSILTIFVTFCNMIVALYNMHNYSFQYFKIIAEKKHEGHE